MYYVVFVLTYVDKHKTYCDITMIGYIYPVITYIYVVNIGASEPFTYVVIRSLCSYTYTFVTPTIPILYITVKNNRHNQI